MPSWLDGQAGSVRNNPGSAGHAFMVTAQPNFHGAPQ